MSAGAFLEAFYETDAGNIAPIRTQPESAALVIEGQTNTIVAGPATAGFPSAVVSRGKRALGVNARTVRVKFPDGTGPDGYQAGGTISLPWYDPTTFALLPTRGTGTYLGSSVTLIGKSPETVR